MLFPKLLFWAALILSRVRLVRLGQICFVIFGCTVGALALLHYNAEVRLRKYQGLMQSAQASFPWLKTYSDALDDDLQRRLAPETTLSRLATRSINVLSWHAEHVNDIEPSPAGVAKAFLLSMRRKLAAAPDQFDRSALQDFIVLQNETLELCRRIDATVFPTDCMTLENYVTSSWSEWLKTVPAKQEFHNGYFLEKRDGLLKIKEKSPYFAEVCNYAPYTIFAQIITRPPSDTASEPANFKIGGITSVPAGSCTPALDAKDLPGTEVFIAASPGYDSIRQSLLKQPWYRSAWQDQTNWVPNSDGPVLCYKSSKSVVLSPSEACESQQEEYFGKVAFDDQGRYVFHVFDEAICSMRSSKECLSVQNEHQFGGLSEWVRDVATVQLVRDWHKDHVAEKPIPYLLGAHVHTKTTDFDRGLTIEKLDEHPLGLAHVLQSKDRITSIAGIPVFSYTDLVSGVAAFGQEHGMLKPIPIEFLRHGQLYTSETGLFFNPTYWGHTCPSEWDAAWSGFWNGVVLGSGLDVAASCGAKSADEPPTEKKAFIAKCERDQHEERWRLRQFCKASFNIAELISVFQTAGGSLLLRGLVRSQSRTLLSRIARGSLFTGAVAGLETLILSYNNSPPGQSKVMTPQEAANAAGIGGVIAVLAGRLRP